MGQYSGFVARYVVKKQGTLLEAFRLYGITEIKMYSELSLVIGIVKGDSDRHGLTKLRLCGLIRLVASSHTATSSTIQKVQIMDDKTKLINALKVAIAEVDKLTKAWDNMMPTHLEYRQKYDKFQPIQVYRMPGNILVSEIYRHDSTGLYALGLLDQRFPPTSSETVSILNKIRELNGESPKSPIGEVTKWNKFPENTPPRVGMRYLVTRKHAPPCVSTWINTWVSGNVFTDFDSCPDENWVTYWMEIPWCPKECGE